MIGELLGESKGKRIGRRVLGINPPTVEVSFEDNGKMLGFATTGMGTYTSVVRADGSAVGAGHGIISTQDGDAVVWKGSRKGKNLAGWCGQLQGDFALSNDLAVAKLSAAPGDSMSWDAP